MFRPRLRQAVRSQRPLWCSAGGIATGILRRGGAVRRLATAMLIVSLLLTIPGLTPLADEGGPSVALAQQFGTADDCVKTDAICAPSGAASITFTESGATNVCQWSATANWGDGTVESISYTGNHTFAHQYTAVGTYTVRITGSGTPLQPNVTCSFGSDTFTVEVPARRPPGRSQQPAGLFRSVATLADQRTVQCDRTTRPTSEVQIAHLETFLAREIAGVPDGWPLISFCATRQGTVHFDIVLIQGAPGLPGGSALPFDVTVSPGWNVVVPPGPPTLQGNFANQNQSFGYLGPFYRIETNQTTSGQTLRKRMNWGYVIYLNPDNQRPTPPGPRAIPIPNP